MVRVDRERRHSLTAETRLRLIAHLREQLPSLQAVILEDYDKGLFDQTLADGLIQAAQEAGVLVLVDPKPSNPVYWHGPTGGFCT
jgi:D-beta-D-heptose 7-phosphate kinase/D-beta-D-heptose 1-phosphate adenosyltransferase